MPVKLIVLTLALIVLAFAGFRTAVALRNRRHNRRIDASSCRGDDALYHGQGRAPLGQMRFGYYSTARSGCGAIAVANTLIRLGHPLPLPEVIAACEWGTPFLGAKVGLNPLTIPAILRCLMHRVGLRGCRVRLRLAAPAMPPADGVLILTHLNGKAFKDGAHTVALYCGENAGTPDARVANTFNNSAAPVRFSDVAAYLRDRRLICAITVEQKR